MNSSKPEDPGHRVEGRVAQVLSERRLVINVGSDHGVTMGMRFAVLAKTRTEIRDPESGDVLDMLDREKVRVRAREVRLRITICETYRTRPALWLSAAAMLGSEQQGPPETLHADASSLPPPLADDEAYVKANDRVVQVTDDD